MPMQRLPGTRSLVPLAVCGALVVVAPAPRAAPHPLVELDVAGVVPLDSQEASILVLRQKGGPSLLPILIGMSEGLAIDQKLKKPPARRPEASDLLEHAIGALGAKVVRVEIQGPQAPLFRARVILNQGGRQVEVEGRPSDSVTLALASHAPIFTSPELLADAGLTPSDLARLRTRNGRSDEPPGLGPQQRF